MEYCPRELWRIAVKDIGNKIYRSDEIHRSNRKKVSGSLFLSLDGFLLGDVDSVEELPDVLVLDEDALLDLGGGLGDQLEVVSLDRDLVLLTRLDTFDARGHGNATDVLLAQEVTDLHIHAVVLDSDIDGEMGVDALHLVPVAISDALHHILNVRNASTDRRDVFAVSEPFLSLDSLLSQHLDVQLGVLEGLAEDPALALDGDDAVVDARLDSLGDLHLQTRVNGLHFYSFFSRLNKKYSNQFFKQIETTQL